ncbi:hypothetical protein ABTX35_19310 [Streptomyces sp. NPDC096080]|uniref:hypothetical protein n=1 Tax=Streptomyces sp. NPDC096080 TaxID=3156693 RepID=UPI003321C3A4
MRTRRRRGCEWLAPSRHSLTRPRLYSSGWWCDLHAPRVQQGLPPLPESPGWPVHHVPAHGTDPEPAPDSTPDEDSKDTTT